MRLIRIVLIALTLGLTGTLALLAGPGPSHFALQARAMPASDWCADPEELAFLTLINDYRAANGFGPLVLTQTLGAAAEHHSRDMATNNYVSHTLANGTGWSQNMTDHGYTYNTYRGENIAAGYGTAALVFAGWKASPDHNLNMLGANYTAIGIGQTYGASSTFGWYWTTTFGGYSDAAAAVCSAPAPTSTSAPLTATPAPATATATPPTATAVPPTATTEPPSAPAEPTASLYVASISGKGFADKDSQRLSLTVRVSDPAGGWLGEADVTVALTAPDGSTQTVMMTTNGGGQATWSGPASPGTYHAKITGVSIGDTPWRPSASSEETVSVAVP